jgi:hypothetical protein
VCGLHHAQEDEERGFLGLASKPRSTISPSLASKSVASGFFCLGLKTGSYDLVIWASKLLRWFLGLGIKASKSTALGF